MERTKTRGKEPPVPSQVVKLPRYVIARKRGKATVYYFQVPARLRPDGFAAAQRLPIDEARRSGRGDAAEIAAVVADGKRLYEMLLKDRSGIDREPDHGTMAWLIRSYEKTERFSTRAKATQSSYAGSARVVTGWADRAVLETGSQPLVKDFTRPALLQFLDTLSNLPSKRNAVARYLGVLMKHAIDKGIITVSPATNMHLTIPESRVVLWTPDELDAVVKSADDAGRPSIGTAVLIAHEAGQRQGDILKLQEPRDYDRKEGVLRFWQNKTNSYVTIPATDRLKVRLAGRDQAQLVLVVSETNHKRYTSREFKKAFRKIAIAAGLKNLWFMHLRHTAVVNYARAGCTVPEIASITGHTVGSVNNILKHYLPRDSELAKGAVAKLERAKARK